jgi:hypothetical protein
MIAPGVQRMREWLQRQPFSLRILTLARSLREPERTRTNLAARTKQQEGSDMDTKTRHMDTKTLVVGQDVYMLKPPYPFWFCFDEGKVVKVTPERVDVQVVDRQTANAAYCQRKDRGDKAIKITPSRGKETDVGRCVEVQVADLQTADMIRFDTSGKETDVSRRDRLGFGPSPEDRFYTSLWYSAPEFGPWHLDDMPFEKRKHLLENQFDNSSLLKEIYKLAYDCPSIPNVLSPSFQQVETDNGLVYAFSLRASYAPEDDDLIEVTDEELLKKLRSIKGQYFCGVSPVFYYDLLSGRPCDSSVHRTGILNLPSGRYGIEGNLTEIRVLTARCANCRSMRIAHNPDDQKYAWYRRKGMCEHFKEPPAKENEAKRSEANPCTIRSFLGAAT